MECIACGGIGGYNRAVVDERTGREVGRLCMRCERSTFGDQLDAFHDGDPTGCSFCDSSGAYSLPKWLPDYREADGDIHCFVYLAVDETTVRLCDEHVETLRETVLVGEPTPTAERGRRTRPGDASETVAKMRREDR